MISIAQKYKYFVAIQIAGRRVTCVAYDIKLSKIYYQTTQPKSTHSQQDAKVPRHGFLAQRLNGRV